MFKIIDWAGNEIKTPEFKTWDDGEAWLCEKLDEKYEEERGEYYVVGSEEVRAKKYLHLEGS